MGTNGYMVNPFMLTANLGNSSSMLNNNLALNSFGGGGGFPMSLWSSFSQLSPSMFTPSFGMFDFMNSGFMNGFINSIIPTSSFDRAQSGCGQYVVDHKKLESKYSPMVEKYAKQYGLDADVVKAMVRRESGFNPSLTSKKGAMGLMQLMPGTAKSLGVKNGYDPEQSIAGGTKYLAQLLKRYNGDYRKAVAAYNGGPGNIDKKGIDFCEETRNYHKAILGPAQA